MDPQMLHPTRSVGSVVKKIVEINPDLNSQEVIDIVRRSLKSQPREPGLHSYPDSLVPDLLDEDLALSLAKATLKTC